jgi:hypothetical protein
LGQALWLGCGTLTTQYAYSGDGVRLAQTVNGNDTGGDATTRYVVDRAAPLPQVLMESKPGTQVAYLYGAGPIAQYDVDSGAWAYQHPDALGSVRQLTDAGGNVTQARFYTPFGAPQAAYGQPAPGSLARGSRASNRWIRKSSSKWPAP